MYVFNTLGRRVERFSPGSPPFVSMYTCGPTPYDYTHIGHARTFVSFDAIKRYLNLRGYSVFHVQNITDIDDKIINRARESGRSWSEVAEEYTKDYMDMLSALKISIDLHPKVTDHISDIVDFIKDLIDKGHAYVAESGSVYFSVESYPDYGRLVGLPPGDSWRQEEEFMREKRSPYDFALWKAAKPGEPSWESPWGKGRPGWHIECSVMSSKYLGQEIDIHGGGIDLVFPHHENERAQSESRYGKRPWVRYWMHTSYLTIRGEKMSKSLGNIVPFREAVKKWGAGSLRLWLLSSHYRATIDYSEQSLEQASRLHQRLRDVMERTRRRLEKGSVSFSLGSRELEALERIKRVRALWHSSMSEDFNFGAAASALWELTSLYYKEIDQIESGAVMLYLYKTLEEMNKVYAFADESPASHSSLDAELINLIVEVRRELREKKMYDLSDMIRDRLQRMGIRLFDHKDRTEWRRE